MASTMPPSVKYDDRSDQNFDHSERSTRGSVTRMLSGIATRRATGLDSTAVMTPPGTRRRPW
jgi:hypothetical protein